MGASLISAKFRTARVPLADTVGPNQITYVDHTQELCGLPHNGLVFRKEKDGKIATSNEEFP